MYFREFFCRLTFSLLKLRVITSQLKSPTNFVISSYSLIRNNTQHSLFYLKIIRIQQQLHCTSNPSEYLSVFLRHSILFIKFISTTIHIALCTWIGMRWRRYWKVTSFKLVMYSFPNAGFRWASNWYYELEYFGDIACLLCTRIEWVCLWEITSCHSEWVHYSRFEDSP